MSIIQNEFDKGNGDFKLAPGEYEGPLVINRPCTVDGGNSTLWAQSGPVLRIEASGVTIRNLRVEIAGSDSQSGNTVAIASSAGDTVLTCVEVKGSVSGIPGEPEDWDAPSVISLKDFAANRENSFTYEISVPTEASLECALNDVEISPLHLHAGRNTLLIKTAAMRDNTILYGELLLKTVVSRRIYLSGRSRKNAEVQSAAVPLTGSLPISEPVQIKAPDVVIAPHIPEDQDVQALRRGQRVPVSEMGAGVFKIAFEHADDGESEDIDPYVFRLSSSGKVLSDDDLFFFGNSEDDVGDVRILTDNTQTIAIIDLSRAAEHTEKYAVCFSIYEESGKDFSSVREPRVRLILDGRDRFRFDLEDLTREKTVVAVELYRHKGLWKLSAVGRGYQNGLAQLCESYGVSVES